MIRRGLGLGETGVWRVREWVGQGDDGMSDRVYIEVTPLHFVFCCMAGLLLLVPSTN